jgi:hypothetical protein
MGEIREDIDHIISRLEEQGIRSTSHNDPNMTGLGDVIEYVLSSAGITEERFKEFFGLKECNCSKRKAWLNNIFSWHKNNHS